MAEYEGMYVLGRVLGEYLIAKNMRGEIERAIDEEEKARKEGRVRKIGDEEYIEVEKGKYLKTLNLSKDVVGKLPLPALKQTYNLLLTRQKVDEDELMGKEKEIEIRNYIRKELPLLAEKLKPIDLIFLEIYRNDRDIEGLKTYVESLRQRKETKQGVVYQNPEKIEEEKVKQAISNFSKKMKSKYSIDELNEWAKENGYGSWANFTAQLYMQKPPLQWFKDAEDEIMQGIEERRKRTRKEIKEQQKKEEEKYRELGFIPIEQEKKKEEGFFQRFIGGILK